MHGLHIIMLFREKKILFTLTLTADFLIFKFLKNLIYLNVSENGHRSICLCKTPVPFRSARGPTQTHIIFLYDDENQHKCEKGERERSLSVATSTQTVCHLNSL